MTKAFIGKAIGLGKRAASLTPNQIAYVREHAVLIKNIRLVKYCDRALAGSQRARVAIARWVLLGETGSRPCDAS